MSPTIHNQEWFLYVYYLEGKNAMWANQEIGSSKRDETVPMKQISVHQCFSMFSHDMRAEMPTL